MATVRRHLVDTLTTETVSWPQSASYYCIEAQGGVVT